MDYEDRLTVTVDAIVELARRWRAHNRGVGACANVIAGAEGWGSRIGRAIEASRRNENRYPIDPLVLEDLADAIERDGGAQIFQLDAQEPTPAAVAITTHYDPLLRWRRKRAPMSLETRAAALAWVHERIGLLDTLGAMFLAVKLQPRIKKRCRQLRDERARWEIIRAHLAGSSASGEAA